MNIKDNPITRYVGAAAAVAVLGLGYLGVFADDPAAGYAEGDCVVAAGTNEVSKAGCGEDGALIVLKRVGVNFDCNVVAGSTAWYTETIGDETVTLCLGEPTSAA